MTDITVEEIIRTFQGVQRPEIYSTADSDAFLETFKKKKDWTLEEYREFSLAYMLEYMHVRFMDSLAFYRLRKQYNFELTWDDYFLVIESIINTKKQREYLNYYFSQYYGIMNETVYKELMAKPYFKYLTTKSKSKFLGSILETDNSNKWVNNYFTDSDFRNALKNARLHIKLYDSENSEKMEQKVKEFYNHYEKFMNHKTKTNFFNQVVERGSLPLIQFLYEEKGLRGLSKLVLLWHVCADTASGNPLEIMRFLRNLGMKFTQKDLKNSQQHGQWGHMERTDELIYFFNELECEKNYNKLDKKLKPKTVKKKSIKV